MSRWTSKWMWKLGCMCVFVCVWWVCYILNRTSKTENVTVSQRSFVLLPLKGKRGNKKFLTSAPPQQQLCKIDLRNPECILICYRVHVRLAKIPMGPHGRQACETSLVQVNVRMTHANLCSSYPGSLNGFRIGLSLVGKKKDFRRLVWRPEM